MKFILILPLVLALLQNSRSLHLCNGPASDLSEPLILTPLIRDGELQKAKQLSFVESFPGFDYVSYSGFITVDEKHDSNMFFWYFLSKHNPENAPVLLWMTGGPGISSLYGLFGETGPFYTDANLTLKSRIFNWISDHNVIYVDVPVGAGFSFTNSTSGYAHATPQIVSQVVKFLDQFFTLFVEHKSNDFYIVGKSYSGKVAVALTTELLERRGQLPANLMGVVSVCGFLDAVNMSVKSDHLFHLGFLSENQRKIIADLEVVMVDSYLNGSFSQALKAYSKIARELTKWTGMKDLSNLLFIALPREFTDYERFVDHKQVRKMLHVGDRPFSGPEYVSKAINDTLNSSKSHVEYILNNSNLKVLLISAQLDLYVAPSVQRQLVTTLNWPGRASYNAAPRVIYKVDPSDEEVAGFVQQAGQLTEVMIKSAGHMVSYDQPRSTLDVLKRFIRNQPFA